MMKRAIFAALVAAAVVYWLRPARDAAATVTTSTTSVTSSASGMTGTFPVPFPFANNSDLKVTDNGTLKTLTTHYTVTCAGCQSGANVVFNVNPAAGHIITITRVVPLTQPFNARSQGLFRPASYEAAYDWEEYQIQQLQQQIYNVTSGDGGTAITVFDEGVSQGAASSLNCVGDAITCSVAAGAGTVLDSAPIITKSYSWTSETFAPDAGNVSAITATAHGSATAIQVKPSGASKTAAIDFFNSSGSVAWSIGKQTDDSFFVHDSSTGYDLLSTGAGVLTVQGHYGGLATGIPGGTTTVMGGTGSADLANQIVGGNGGDLNLNGGPGGACTGSCENPGATGGNVNLAGGVGVNGGPTGTVNITTIGTTSKAFSVGTTATGGAGYELQVAERIQTITPAPQSGNFPMGNDLWLMARGSADLRLQNWSASLTSTTTIAAPGSVTITVASPKQCMGANQNGTCESRTANPTAILCLPGAGCGLEIDRDGANAELILPANWSITTSSTITATFAKTHTQPYNVSQVGGVFFDARNLYFGTTAPAGTTIGLNDTNGVSVMGFPNDTSAAFPASALKFRSILTGDVSGTDFDIRNQTTGGAFNIINFANSANLLHLTETSASANLFLGNPTNNSLEFKGNSDIGRIYGGGTSIGLQFYSAQAGAGAGTKGTFDFYDNDASLGSALTVNTSTKKITIPGAIKTGNASGTDLAGIGTCGGNAFTLTYAGTYTGVPSCTCVDVNAGAGPYACWISAQSNTAVTFKQSGGATDNINYHCIGQN